MPRQVDNEARRRDIRMACLDVIAEEGTRGLSFRAVAERMGGSTTLITHYYPSQRALIEDLAAGLVDSWTADLAELDATSSDPLERLRNLLEWLLPISKQGVKEERARINLLAERLLGEEHRVLFDAWASQTRRYLRDHVVDVVPEADVESTIDVLHSVTNGIVLSAVEQAEDWPADRQRRVIRHVLAALGLAAGDGPGAAQEISVDQQ